jgi:F420-0:gamma-glutamyl ligase-like protein
LAVHGPLERRCLRRRGGRREPADETDVARQNVVSGGLGFRYALANKFGMHAGIDVAHSPGTTAVYFVIGNAWFRP